MGLSYALKYLLSFLNLWCELNQLCHDIDESFPDPHDEHELVKDYCKAHPYYFIDILPPNTAVDDFFKGNVQLINNFMMALAEQQIKAAFEQSEKEVTDLHSRISQGMREAKKNGIKIGLPQGTTLTTKKALECMAIIKKHSKDFGGSLEDPDVIKLCGCSRNSYYKYKKELKAG